MTVDPKPNNGIVSRLVDALEKLILWATYDSSKPQHYLYGNFAPVAEETPPCKNLPVRGFLPVRDSVEFFFSFYSYLHLARISRLCILTEMEICDQFSRDWGFPPKLVSVDIRISELSAENDLHISRSALRGRVDVPFAKVCDFFDFGASKRTNALLGFLIGSSKPFSCCCCGV